jgi:hypothetical protein
LIKLVITLGLKEQLIFQKSIMKRLIKFKVSQSILEHGSQKYRSDSIDKILNGMILFKFLRFPLNDCGYYEKYESFSEINQAWDKKRNLKRKRWSQE